MLGAGAYLPRADYESGVVIGGEAFPGGSRRAIRKVWHRSLGRAPLHVIRPAAQDRCKSSSPPSAPMIESAAPVLDVQPLNSYNVAQLQYAL